ncbi:EPIDERMAL PATTERNING FACTOR-like protein 8 [Carya illinoinensis]|uniref:EPIDERMAL PATTERNING FACTOR-like protein 8 n=1 Tax=Carya illinoinensis TaxID=32201 RepID=UPI001C71CE7C|nr:EPIDERMAL PATTERNING FACTOR-like protein 8 [Carya illinoinensis]
MAPRTCLRGLKVAVTVAFVFFLTFIPPKSGYGESLARKELVLGSKPPACVNKCLNCRPCIATLVIPSHQSKGSFAAWSLNEDDSYYLLTWKCRCGNKFYQP